MYTEERAAKIIVTKTGFTMASNDEIPYRKSSTVACSFGEDDTSRGVLRGVVVSGEGDPSPSSFIVEAGAKGCRRVYKLDVVIEG